MKNTRQAIPTGIDTKKPTIEATPAPMAAPISGTRSVTATMIASGSAYGTPAIDRNRNDVTPAISEMIRLPATYPPTRRSTSSPSSRTRSRRLFGTSR